MTKISIAKPSSGPINRTRRKLTDYGGSNTWDGSKDSLNVLHQVYRGRFDRFEKYRNYEWMDQDSDISRALDLVAEHCSEKDVDGRYFNLDWVTDETTAELGEILKAHIDQWSKINTLRKKLFATTRNVLKYGDWFMFRNPNTFELYDIHPMDVMGAIVDRNTLDILGWVIRDFRWNIQDMEINVESRELQQQMQNFNATSASTTSQGAGTRAIPAVHILHFSLSEGKLASAGINNSAGTSKFSNSWPFGNSWLDKIHKTFKQKELIEEAALIHRVQRAPSRHVWYIDTGKQRHDRAKYVVQNFKNELNQKRIPQFIGDNSRSVDSVYNPISQLEDYYIPVSMDQRGSKVEQLEGTPWSDMPDLEHFTKKMASSLRVPYAWLMPSGDGGITPSDGRAGVATQEEIEFSRFCSRVQTYLIEPWDREFKLYANWRDVQANWGDFELMFNPPTDYQASRDRARFNESINAYKQLAEIPHFSRRLAMKMTLGMTDDEIATNEKMYYEEIRGSDTGMNSMDVGGAGLAMDDLPMGGEGLEVDTEAPMGGDQLGAGGMDMSGGGFGGGDMTMSMGMESVDRDDEENFLFEIDDVAANLPSQKVDVEDDTRVPDDQSLKNDDPIKGKPIATLALIQKLRHAHFSKRIDWQKRMKMLNKIYAPTGGDDGGAPPMGGF